MLKDEKTPNPMPSNTDASEAAAKTTGERLWRWYDWPAALLLFAASAAVVVWQNSRLGVLWDASYILENSYRISLGDVPYRDFPFPYAPLTFLTQAAVIKLAGRAFWHHIVYSATVGGLSAVLAWRVILNTLRGSVTRARLVALLLSAPLVVLGIYAIFPPPFYAPDCTFVILVCLLLLQWAERKGLPPSRAIVAGSALVVPLFVKQNTGLAFILSACAALAALFRAARLRGAPGRKRRRSRCGAADSSNDGWPRQLRPLDGSLRRGATHSAARRHATDVREPAAASVAPGPGPPPATAPAPTRPPQPPP